MEEMALGKGLHLKSLYEMNYLKEGSTVTSLLSLILMIETALERIGWHTKRVIIESFTLCSFGNLRPPSDLVKYLGAGTITL